VERSDEAIPIKNEIAAPFALYHMAQSFGLAMA
jgi:hypothetical protein